MKGDRVVFTGNDGIARMLSASATIPYGIVKGTGSNRIHEKGVKLGLDLAGGVSITYQVKGDEITVRRGYE